MGVEGSSADVHDRAAAPEFVGLSVTESTGESVSTEGVVSGVPLLPPPPHAVKIRDETIDSGRRYCLYA